MRNPNFDGDAEDDASAVGATYDIDGILPRQHGGLFHQRIRRNTVRSWLLSLTDNDQERTRVVADTSEEPQDENDEGTKLKILEREYCLFDRCVSRGPPMDYSSLSTIENAHNLAQLNATNSTATDLAQWLQHPEHRYLSKCMKLGPLDLLFNIIYGDTLEVVRLMHSALSEIGHDILDESIIQERLLHWRYLIEKFDSELRQLQDSLQDFGAFLLCRQATRRHVQHPRLAETEGDTSLRPLELQLQNAFDEITSLRQRTASSYNSLMANMSIIESKRGIAEAESVTKLTELAFLFIPLTFSASIFSMQVRELNATRVSIWAFILLAICITFGSYGLRLFIRSESVIRLKKRSLEKVRADAMLTPGSPIPSRYFLTWIWSRIRVPIIYASLFIIFLVSSIVPLWIRGHNAGFTSVMTILILVFELTVACFAGYAMIYRDRRGLHFHRRSVLGNGAFKI